MNTRRSRRTENRAIVRVVASTLFSSDSHARRPTPTACYDTNVSRAKCYSVRNTSRPRDFQHTVVDRKHFTGTLADRTLPTEMFLSWDYLNHGLSTFTGRTWNVFRMKRDGLGSMQNNLFRTIRTTERTLVCPKRNSAKCRVYITLLNTRVRFPATRMTRAYRVPSLNDCHCRANETEKQLLNLMRRQRPEWRGGRGDTVHRR